MRRNPAIEFYRILMMFGIVLLHVCQQRAGSWPNNVLVSCVPGFVLISGYFGIKFSWRKLLGLYLVAIYASVLVPLVGGVTSWPAYSHEVLRVWNIRLDAVQPRGFWFLHAYAIMSVMAIPIEMLLVGGVTEEKFKRLWRLSLPVFVIVFGWGFLTKFRTLAPVVPTVNGLQAFSPLTLFASYLLGRLLRLGEMLHGGVVCRRPYAAIAFLVFLGIIGMTRTYLCSYNSIFSVVLAMAAFYCIKDIPLPEILGKLILLVSPSMFAIYVIHTHLYLPNLPHEYMSLGRTVLERLISDGVDPSMAIGATTLLLFFASIVLDLPRRFARATWLKMKGRATK